MARYLFLSSLGERIASNTDSRFQKLADSSNQASTRRNEKRRFDCSNRLFDFLIESWRVVLGVGLQDVRRVNQVVCRSPDQKSVTRSHIRSLELPLELHSRSLELQLRNRSLELHFGNPSCTLSLLSKPCSSDDDELACSRIGSFATAAWSSTSQPQLGAGAAQQVGAGAAQQVGAGAAQPQLGAGASQPQLGAASQQLLLCSLPCNFPKMPFNNPPLAHPQQLATLGSFAAGWSRSFAATAWSCITTSTTIKQTKTSRSVRSRKAHSGDGDESDSD